jgi:hypothetical protein
VRFLFTEQMLVIRSVDNIFYSNKTAETPRYVHADRRSCYCHSALVRQTGEEITERCCHSIIGTQWGSDRDQANSARKRRKRKRNTTIRGLTQERASSGVTISLVVRRWIDVTGSLPVCYESRACWIVWGGCVEKLAGQPTRNWLCLYPVCLVDAFL